MEGFLNGLEDIFCLFCDGVYKVFLVGLFLLELAIVFIVFPMAIFGAGAMIYFEPTNVAKWVVVILFFCFVPLVIKGFWKSVKSTWQAFLSNLRDSDN